MRNYRSEEPKHVCGTCRYHYHESIDNGWICANTDSEYCADWTEFDDHCEDWEPREEKQ